MKGFKGQAFDKLCSLMKKEGYATTYAITGEAIRELQDKAVRNGKKLVDFNTYACSMGFPARTIFEKRLTAFRRSRASLRT